MMPDLAKSPATCLAKPQPKGSTERQTWMMIFPGTDEFTITGCTDWLTRCMAVAFS